MLTFEFPVTEEDISPEGNTMLVIKDTTNKREIPIIVSTLRVVTNLFIS